MKVVLVALTLAFPVAFVALAPEAEATRCVPDPQDWPSCWYRDLVWNVEDDAEPWCRLATGEPYCVPFPPLP